VKKADISSPLYNIINRSRIALTVEHLDIGQLNVSSALAICFCSHGIPRYSFFSGPLLVVYGLCQFVSLLLGSLPLLRSHFLEVVERFLPCFGLTV